MEGSQSMLGRSELCSRRQRTSPEMTSEGETMTAIFTTKGLPRRRSGEEPACQRGRPRRHGSDPWVGKIPWRRARQPTPVFLPGESHGQRSLAGYSPRGCKELDTTEAA